MLFVVDNFAVFYVDGCYAIAVVVATLVVGGVVQVAIVAVVVNLYIGRCCF